LKSPSKEQDWQEGSALGLYGPSVTAGEELLKVAWASLLDSLVDLPSDCIFKGLVNNVSEDSNGFWKLGVSHA
jgi:hypothetical protein